MGPCLKFTGTPALDLLPPTTSALRQTQLDTEGYSIHSRTISHHSQLCKCTGCPHSLGVTPTTMNTRRTMLEDEPSKSGPPPQGVAFLPDTSHRMRCLCHAIERAHCHSLPQISATGATTACSTTPRFVVAEHVLHATQSERSRNVAPPQSRQTHRTCAKKSEVISE